MTLLGVRPLHPLLEAAEYRDEAIYDLICWSTEEIKRMKEDEGRFLFLYSAYDDTILSKCRRNVCGGQTESQSFL